jgi:hypothetical protein
LTKLFLLGFVAGVVLIMAGAGLYPLPDHERFRSNIEVLTNGGRQESFLIRWPQDRIALPAALKGTSPVVTGGGVVLDPGGNPAVIEMFRLRDADGNVIGIASRATGRMPGQRVAAASATNWMLSIPSRGTLLMAQENSADILPMRVEDGYALPAETTEFWAPGTRYRITAGPAPEGRGRILRGTNEFASLTGSYTELWELEEVAADGHTSGRITLSTITTGEP